MHILHICVYVTNCNDVFRLCIERSVLCILNIYISYLGPRALGYKMTYESISISSLVILDHFRFAHMHRFLGAKKHHAHKSLLAYIRRTSCINGNGANLLANCLVALGCKTFFAIIAKEVSWSWSRSHALQRR